MSDCRGEKCRNGAPCQGYIGRMRKNTNALVQGVYEDDEMPCLYPGSTIAEQVEFAKRHLTMRTKEIIIPPFTPWYDPTY